MGTLWDKIVSVAVHPGVALAVGLVVGFVVGWYTGCLRFAGGSRANGARRKAKAVGGRRASSNGTPVADGAVELYVGNLSYDMTEDQLRTTFEKFGKVASARIITHRMSKRSKGFGFVIMPTRSEAMAAIKALNERDIMGRALRVNEARGMSS